MLTGEDQVFENMEVTLMKFPSAAMTRRDVKNEDCSSEFIENKWAKKVLLRS